MNKKETRGGARPNSGPKGKPAGERKSTVPVQVKAKHYAKAKKHLQAEADKLYNI